jgi:glycosyltransferase involved in cell wall biosynthesis
MVGSDRRRRHVLSVKILVVHNAYRRFSGEEAAVETQMKVLGARGHRILSFPTNVTDLETGPLSKARAFFSGIYSLASKRMMQQLLREYSQDIVHIHNLFPWISPSILPECRRAGVPVVMTVHNYRLVCPNGLHMPKGRHEVCEKCCGGREYWCVLRNCEQSYWKSLGYVARTYTARRFGFFRKNITVLVCLTQFQRQRLIAEGYPEDRLQVIPNTYGADVEIQKEQSTPGCFVAYVGRISPEKGIELLLSAAERLRAIPFHLAGNYDAMPDLVGNAPANVSFLGNLDRKHVADFYGRSRFVILCSTCFEGFPMTVVEAMAHGRPVIASRIGGIPEIVDDGVTGLLFTPGDVNELTEKVRYLWGRPDLCRQMGQAGREKALREYSPEKYYERLMAIYEEATRIATREVACRL